MSHDDDAMMPLATSEAPQLHTAEPHTPETRASEARTVEPAAAAAPPVRPIPQGLAEAAALIGGPDQTLSDEQIREFVAAQVGSIDAAGKSVCVIIPDGTRSVPLPRVLPEVHRQLAGLASRITVLIALGTHAAMSEEHVETMLGAPRGGLKEIGRAHV